MDDYNSYSHQPMEQWESDMLDELMAELEEQETTQ